MVTEEMSTRLMKLLREDMVMKSGEIDDLVELGVEAIDLLIDALNGSDRRQLVNAMSVLEQIGKSHASKAIPALLALQSHHHTWVRMSSAKAIGILGSTAEVKPLADWLRAESDVLVQIWIVISLGRLGSAEAVGTLLTALHRTNCTTLRYTIIRALGDLGDCRAIPVISIYLADEDRHVRKDAESALRRLRGLEQEESRDER